ncbi:NUDIX hydrolase [Halegenticoccus soli]|uniref:hypothetical protein n=1 Tax=Halegenticoccus soli TaxID=1985678 RepID=UPI000C6D520B|nr:hypothetical protein [Halegenticoccus soli]
MRSSAPQLADTVDFSDIELIATSIGPAEDEENDDPEFIAVIGPAGGSANDQNGTLVAEGASIISDTYRPLPFP